MNLGRIFANAIARRVAYVVVALAFAFLASIFGAGNAHAQVGDNKQQAYAKCEAMRAEREASDPSNQHRCTDYPDDLTFAYERFAWGSWAVIANFSYYGCPEGQPWNEAEKTCGTDCSGRSPLGSGAWSGVNSDMQMCQDGCTYEGGIGGGVGVCLPVTIDGTVYQQCTSWGPTGSQCSAGIGNGSLAPPDSDGDGTSDGNDGSPNNPGSGGGGKDGKPGEDGSSSCGGPDQPACEADGSNSGSGKGNTSGGGGNCQTPPSSTGDAILAQIAYQTWATRCAVEGQGNGGTGTGPGDGAKEGTLKGIKDFLDGNGQSLDEPADPWMDGDGITESDWNMGLGGGSCPAPVSTTISLAGVSQSIDFSFQPLCDLAGLLNVLFKALGAFIAAYIIAGVRR